MNGSNRYANSIRRRSDANRNNSSSASNAQGRSPKCTSTRGSSKRDINQRSTDPSDPKCTTSTVPDPGYFTPFDTNYPDRPLASNPKPSLKML